MAGAHPSTVVDYIVSGRLYPVRLSERTVRIPVRAVVDLREPELLVVPVVTIQEARTARAATAQR